MDLRDSNLAGASLPEANLSRAILTMSNLAEADLEGANLSCADLVAAPLFRANLRATNLARASLITANLSGALLGPGARRSLSNIYTRLTQGQLDEALIEPKMPPVITEGTVDFETGEPLEWRGPTGVGEL